MTKDRAAGEDAEGPVEWVSWGMFRVCGKPHGKTEEGKQGVGKDIRVIGREVAAWKERKGHLLTPSMVAGVFDQDVEVLVIGSGAGGAIRCPEEVRRAIREHGIARLIVARTPEACRRYNALLREGKRAALLAHGTC